MGGLPERSAAAQVVVTVAAGMLARALVAVEAEAVEVEAAEEEARPRTTT